MHLEPLLLRIGHESYPIFMPVVALELLPENTLLGLNALHKWYWLAHNEDKQMQFKIIPIFK